MLDTNRNTTLVAPQGPRGRSFEISPLARKRRQDMDPDTGRCSHLAAVLADDTEGAALLDRYKAVVRWNVHRSHEVAYPAKRRKVRLDTATCSVTQSKRLSRRLHLQSVESVALPCPDRLPACTAPSQDAGQTSTSKDISRILVMTSVGHLASTCLGHLRFHPWHGVPDYRRSHR